MTVFVTETGEDESKGLGGRERCPRQGTSGRVGGARENRASLGKGLNISLGQ